MSLKIYIFLLSKGTRVFVVLQAFTYKKADCCWNVGRSGDRRISAGNVSSRSVPPTAHHGGVAEERRQGDQELGHRQRAECSTPGNWVVLKARDRF
jgi:hypothetical protein